MEGINRSCRIHLAEQLYGTLFPGKNSPSLFSAALWASPGAVQTCRAELCVEEKEVLVVLKVLSGALALSSPEAEAPTCAVCALGHSCVVGHMWNPWWEWCTDILSGCRRINFVHRHCSTVCASCSSSEHPCKSHTVCCSLHEAKCTRAFG